VSDKTWSAAAFSRVAMFVACRDLALVVVNS
jgi:hypothetical protein